MLEKIEVLFRIHYGSIVGTKQDSINFVELLKPTIEGKILMK